MSHTRVWDLLQALRSVLGIDTRRRIAAAVRVEPRAVDYWYQQGPRANLRGANLDALMRFAISVGIDPRQFETSTPLWRPELSFDDQLRYDPGPHPEHLGFQRQHLPILGRILDTYFGSAAGPIAQSPLQMYHLAKTGCGFVTTRSFLPYARRSNPAPYILQYIDDTKYAVGNQQEERRCVVFDDPEPGFRPTRGLGTNTGFPSPPPSAWIENVLEAQRMLTEDPDTDTVPLIVSVAGFAGETNKTHSEIVIGYQEAVRLAVKEAGAEIVEVNIGCPSIARLLSTEIGLIQEIVAGARKEAGERKLILKLGAWPNLEDVILRVGSIVDAIATTSSIRVDAVRLDHDGRQHNAWVYGTPGLVGSPIFRTGLDLCRRIVELRDAHRELRQLTLIMSGGVTRPEDVVLYKEKMGVELVAGFTSFFEDPLFGIKVRRFLDGRVAVEVKSASKRREIAASHWAIALDQEMQEVHPAEYRRLVTAASGVLADYFEEVQRVNKAAIGKRAGATPTIDEFRHRIAQKFKGLGGGPIV